MQKEAISLKDEVVDCIHHDKLNKSAAQKKLFSHRLESQQEERTKEAEKVKMKCLARDWESDSGLSGESLMASALRNEINLGMEENHRHCNLVQRHWHVAIRGLKTKWKNNGGLALFSVIYSYCCLVGFLKQFFLESANFSCEAQQQLLQCIQSIRKIFSFGFQHIFTCTTVELLGRKSKIISYVHLQIT